MVTSLCDFLLCTLLPRRLPTFADFLTCVFAFVLSLFVLPRLFRRALVLRLLLSHVLAINDVVNPEASRLW
jgi:hypothetical protein